MTQSGGNGHKPDAESTDITVYEPAFAPETDESVGWFETDIEGKEGELTTDLPLELDDPDDPPN
jgi:hypothetical protein